MEHNNGTTMSHRQSTVDSSVRREEGGGYNSRRMACQRQLPRLPCLEIHGRCLSNEISDWTFHEHGAEQFLPYHTNSRGIEVCSVYADGPASPKTRSAYVLDFATITKLILVAPPDLRDAFLEGFCECRL